MKLSTFVLAAFLSLALAGCITDSRQKGGKSHIQSATGTAVDTQQSENPKDHTKQSLHSKKTTSMVIPAGSTVQVTQPSLSVPAASGKAGVDKHPSTKPASSSAPTNEVATITLSQPTTLTQTIEDDVNTDIGGALKDIVGQMAEGFKALHPLLWVGIAMMTLVPLAAFKMGWPAIAIKSLLLGVAMVCCYYFLPTYGGAILAVGLGVFVLSSLFLVYAYYKGHMAGTANEKEESKAAAAASAPAGSTDLPKAASAGTPPAKVV